MTWFVFHGWPVIGLLCISNGYILSANCGSKIPNGSCSIGLSRRTPQFDASSLIVYLVQLICLLFGVAQCFFNVWRCVVKRFSFPLMGGLTFALAGCATESPMPTKDYAIVGLMSLSSDQLMARTVDGKSSKTFSHFRVPSGNHALELAISKRGPRDSYRQCYTSITFDEFQAGQRYVLTERSAAGAVTVHLSDNTGRQLAQSEDVACLPF